MAAQGFASPAVGRRGVGELSPTMPKGSPYDLSMMAAGVFREEAQTINSLRDELQQTRAALEASREREAKLGTLPAMLRGTEERLRGATLRASSAEATASQLRLELATMEREKRDMEGELTKARADAARALESSNEAMTEASDQISWKSQFEQGYMEARLEVAGLQADLEYRKKLFATEEKLASAEAQVQHWRAIAIQSADELQQRDKQKKKHTVGALGLWITGKDNHLLAETIRAWAGIVFHKDQQELWEMHIYYLRKAANENENKIHDLKFRLEHTLQQALEGWEREHAYHALTQVYRSWQKASIATREAKHIAAKAVGAMSLKLSHSSKIERVSEATLRFWGRKARISLMATILDAWHVEAATQFAHKKRVRESTRDKAGTELVFLHLGRLDGFAAVYATFRSWAVMTQRHRDYEIASIRAEELMSAMRGAHRAQGTLLMDQWEQNLTRSLLSGVFTAWSKEAMRLKKEMQVLEMRKLAQDRERQKQTLVLNMFKKNMGAEGEQLLAFVFNNWRDDVQTDIHERKVHSMQENLRISANRNRLALMRTALQWGKDQMGQQFELIMQSWKQFTLEGQEAKKRRLLGLSHDQILLRWRRHAWSVLAKRCDGELKNHMAIILRSWLALSVRGAKTLTISGLSSSAAQMAERVARHRVRVSRVLTSTLRGEDACLLRMSLVCWLIIVDDRRSLQEQAIIQFEQHAFAEKAIVCWEWSEGAVLLQLTMEFWRQAVTWQALAAERKERLRLRRAVVQNADILVFSLEKQRDDMKLHHAFQRWCEAVDTELLTKLSISRQNLQQMRSLYSWSCSFLQLRIAALKDAMGLQRCLTAWLTFTLEQRWRVNHSAELGLHKANLGSMHRSASDRFALKTRREMDDLLLYGALRVWHHDLTLSQAVASRARSRAQVVEIVFKWGEQQDAGGGREILRIIFHAWQEEYRDNRHEIRLAQGYARALLAEDMHKGVAYRMAYCLAAQVDAASQRVVLHAWLRLMREKRHQAHVSAGVKQYLRETAGRSHNVVDRALAMFIAESLKGLVQVILQEWKNLTLDSQFLRVRMEGVAKWQALADKRDIQFFNVLQGWHSDKTEALVRILLRSWRDYTEAAAQALAASRMGAELNRLRGMHFEDVRKLMLRLLLAHDSTFVSTFLSLWKDLVMSRIMNKTVEDLHDMHGRAHSRRANTVEVCLFRWGVRESAALLRIVLHEWSRATERLMELQERAARSDQYSFLEQKIEAQRMRMMYAWSSERKDVQSYVSFHAWHRFVHHTTQKEAVALLQSRNNRLSQKHYADIRRLVPLFLGNAALAQMSSFFWEWKRFLADEKHAQVHRRWQERHRRVNERCDHLIEGSLLLLSEGDSTMLLQTVLHSWNDLVSQEKDLQIIAETTIRQKGFEDMREAQLTNMSLKWDRDQLHFLVRYLFFAWRNCICDQRQDGEILALRGGVVRLRQVHASDVSRLLFQVTTLQDASLLGTCMARWHEAGADSRAVRHREVSHRHAVRLHRRHKNAIDVAMEHWIDSIEALMMVLVTKRWAHEAFHARKIESKAFFKQRRTDLVHQREEAVKRVFFKGMSANQEIYLQVILNEWKHYVNYRRHGSQSGKLATQVDNLLALRQAHCLSSEIVSAAFEALDVYQAVFRAWLSMRNQSQRLRELSTVANHLVARQQRYAYVLDDIDAIWGTDGLLSLLAIVVRFWWEFCVKEKSTAGTEDLISNAKEMKKRNTIRMKQTLFLWHSCELEAEMRFAFESWYKEFVHSSEHGKLKKTSVEFERKLWLTRGRIHQCLASLGHAEKVTLLLVTFGTWWKEYQEKKMAQELLESHEKHHTAVDAALECWAESDNHLFLKVFVLAWWDRTQKHRHLDVAMTKDLAAQRTAAIHDRHLYGMVFFIMGLRSKQQLQLLFSSWCDELIHNKRHNDVNKAVNRSKILHGLGFSMLHKLSFVRDFSSVHYTFACWRHVATGAAQEAALLAESKRLKKVLHIRGGELVTRTVMAWGTAENVLIRHIVFDSWRGLLRQKAYWENQEQIHITHMNAQARIRARVIAWAAYHTTQQDSVAAKIIVQSWLMVLDEAKTSRALMATSEEKARLRHAHFKDVRMLMGEMYWMESTGLMKQAIFVWQEFVADEKGLRLDIAQEEQLQGLTQKHEIVMTGTLMHWEHADDILLLQTTWHVWVLALMNSHSQHQQKQFKTWCSDFDNKRECQISNTLCKMYRDRTMLEKHIFFHAWIWFIAGGKQDASFEDVTDDLARLRKRQRVHAVKLAILWVDNQDFSFLQYVTKIWMDSWKARKAERSATVVDRLSKRSTNLAHQSIRILLEGSNEVLLLVAWQNWLGVLTVELQQNRCTSEVSHWKNNVDGYEVRMRRIELQWIRDNRSFMGQVFFEEWREYVQRTRRTTYWKETTTRFEEKKILYQRHFERLLLRAISLDNYVPIFASFQRWREITNYSGQTTVMSEEMQARIARLRRRRDMLVGLTLYHWDAHDAQHLTKVSFETWMLEVASLKRAKAHNSFIEEKVRMLKRRGIQCLALGMWNLAEGREALGRYLFCSWREEAMRLQYDEQLKDTKGTANQHRNDHGIKVKRVLFGLTSKHVALQTRLCLTSWKWAVNNEKNAKSTHKHVARLKGIEQHNDIVQYHVLQCWQRDHDVLLLHSVLMPWRVFAGHRREDALHKKRMQLRDTEQERVVRQIANVVKQVVRERERIQAQIMIRLWQRMTASVKLEESVGELKKDAYHFYQLHRRDVWKIMTRLVENDRAYVCREVFQVWREITSVHIATQRHAGLEALVSRLQTRKDATLLEALSCLDRADAKVVLAKALKLWQLDFTQSTMEASTIPKQREWSWERKKSRIEAQASLAAGRWFSQKEAAIRFRIFHLWYNTAVLRIYTANTQGLIDKMDAAEKEHEAQVKRWKELHTEDVQKLLFRVVEGDLMAFLVVILQFWNDLVSQRQEAQAVAQRKAELARLRQRYHNAFDHSWASLLSTDVQLFLKSFFLSWTQIARLVATDGKFSKAHQLTRNVVVKRNLLLGKTLSLWSQDVFLYVPAIVFKSWRWCARESRMGQFVKQQGALATQLEYSLQEQRERDKYIAFQVLGSKTNFHDGIGKIYLFWIWRHYNKALRLAETRSKYNDEFRALTKRNDGVFSNFLSCWAVYDDHVVLETSFHLWTKAALEAEVSSRGIESQFRKKSFSFVDQTHQLMVESCFFLWKCTTIEIRMGDRVRLLELDGQRVRALKRSALLRYMPFSFEDQDLLLLVAYLQGWHRFVDSVHAECRREATAAWHMLLVENTAHCWNSADILAIMKVLLSVWREHVLYHRMKKAVEEAKNLHKGKTFTALENHFAERGQGLLQHLIHVWHKDAKHTRRLQHTAILIEKKEKLRQLYRSTAESLLMGLDACRDWISVQAKFAHWKSAAQDTREGEMETRFYKKEEEFRHSSLLVNKRERTLATSLIRWGVSQDKELVQLLVSLWITATRGARFESARLEEACKSDAKKITQLLSIISSIDEGKEGAFVGAIFKFWHTEAVGARTVRMENKFRAELAEVRKEHAHVLREINYNVNAQRVHDLYKIEALALVQKVMSLWRRDLLIVSCAEEIAQCQSMITTLKASRCEVVLRIHSHVAHEVALLHLLQIFGHWVRECQEHKILFIQESLQRVEHERNATSEAHDLQVQDMNRQVEEWRRSTESWAMQTRSRHQRVIDILIAICSREHDRSGMKTALGAWKKIILQDKVAEQSDRITEVTSSLAQAKKDNHALVDAEESLRDKLLTLEAGMADRAFEVETEQNQVTRLQRKLEEDTGRMREQIQQLEAKLKKSLETTLELRRAKPGSGSGAAIGTDHFQALFQALIELVFGGSDAAWQHTGLRRDMRMTKSHFLVVMDKLTIADKTKNQVWQMFATQSRSKGELSFDEFTGRVALAGSSNSLDIDIFADSSTRFDSSPSQQASEPRLVTLEGPHTGFQALNVKEDGEYRSSTPAFQNKDFMYHERRPDLFRSSFTPTSSPPESNRRSKLGSSRYSEDENRQAASSSAGGLDIDIDSIFGRS